MSDEVDRYTHGSIHWTELNSKDVAGAKAFYEAVFGWRWTTMPMPNDEGDYHVAMIGDHAVCGAFEMSGPAFAEIPEHWLTYFTVDDADASCAKIAEAGGAVMRPPFDVPGVGRIAIVRAPTGAVSGVMTPTPPAQS